MTPLSFAGYPVARGKEVGELTNDFVAGQPAMLTASHIVKLIGNPP